MSILITGVPGWLGTRLTEALSSGIEFHGKYFPPRKVRCLVLRNIDLLSLKQLDISLFCGDVNDASTLVEPFKSVESVFHLCGLIHPKGKVNDFFEINTKGTKNVLNAAIKAGVKRFIYMSSNSVAGIRFNKEVMTEEDIPAPYMAYGKSKYLAEKMVLEAASNGLIEAVIIRTCWFYGPNQPERQTRFFRMIKNGNPIIFGSGNNLRSMSYIDNSIQGLFLAEKSEIANGRVYWIADRRPYSTIEIYRTIAELLEIKDFKPRFVPGVISEVCKVADGILQKFGFYVPEIHVAGEMNKDIACSIEKAEKELGYNPEVDLKEGMRRSIKWCRENGILI